MKQELTIPEQDSNIDIKIGDMFRWTEKASLLNVGRKFIFLSEVIGFIEIPINKDIHCGSGVWSGLNVRFMIDYINKGEVERLPKGTTFTITQE